MDSRRKINPRPTGTSWKDYKKGSLPDNNHSRLEVRRITLVVTKKASKTRIVHTRKVFISNRKLYRSRAMGFSLEIWKDV